MLLSNIFALLSVVLYHQGQTQRFMTVSCNPMSFPSSALYLYL